MLRLETNTDVSSTMDRVVTKTYSYYTAPDFRNKNTIRYTLRDGDEDTSRDGVPDRMVIEDGTDLVYDPPVPLTDSFEIINHTSIDSLAGQSSMHLAENVGDTTFVITSQLLDAMADGVVGYSFTIDGNEETDGHVDTGDDVEN